MIVSRLSSGTQWLSGRSEDRGLFHRTEDHVVTRYLRSRGDLHAQRTQGFSVSFAGALGGADRLTLTGKITDAAGKPLEHATVMVFKARR